MLTRNSTDQIALQWMYEEVHKYFGSPDDATMAKIHKELSERFDWILTECKNNVLHGVLKPSDRACDPVLGPKFPHQHFVKLVREINALDSLDRAFAHFKRQTKALIVENLEVCTAPSSEYS